ncbi:hypothetical protein ACP70R_040646 [Stipagrostis hirtigluma subsp. patula]
MAVAQIFYSVYFSAWSNKFYSKPHVFSSVVLFLGNVCYAMAYDMKYLTVLIVGRLLCGVKWVLQELSIAGTLVIVSLQGYACKHQQDLLVQVHFGMACGPTLAGLLLWKFMIYMVTFNQSTLPGWVMAVAWLLYLVWLWISFKERNRATEVNDAPENPASGRRVGIGQLENGLAQPLLGDSRNKQNEDEDEVVDDSEEAVEDSRKPATSIGSAYRLLTPSVKVSGYRYGMLHPVKLATMLEVVGGDGGGVGIDGHGRWSQPSGLAGFQRVDEVRRRQACADVMLLVVGKEQEAVLAGLPVEVEATTTSQRQHPATTSRRQLGLLARRRVGRRRGTGRTAGARRRNRPGCSPEVQCWRLCLDNGNAMAARITEKRIQTTYMKTTAPIIVAITALPFSDNITIVYHRANIFAVPTLQSQSSLTRDRGKLLYMHAAGQRGSDAAAGLRLFGVQLHAAAAAGGAGSPALQLQKSYSVDCLQLQGSSPAYALVAAPLFLPSSSSPSSALLLSIDECPGRVPDGGGYLSDDGGRGGAALRERKKGVPWSEEEHRLFLAGLERLGKGDWRGISRGFVTTRTPTQVASHAQKFFLRQQSGSGKKNSKRRSSLFDMVQNREGRREDVAAHSNFKGNLRCLPPRASHRVPMPWEESTTAIDGMRPSSEALISETVSVCSRKKETVSVITEQDNGHGYHCSPLNLELGMSLSTPSIGI